MKWLQLAARNVLRHQRRTVMAATIVATGSAAVLVAVGYMLATFWGLREMTIRGELGHIQIAAHGQFDASTEATERQGLEAGTAERIINHAQSLPGVRDVLRRVTFDLTGLPPPTVTDQMQAMLAVDLARSLGVKPGDMITLLSNTADGMLNGIDVTVAGIYQTGVPEYDKRAMMITLQAAKVLMKSDRVMRLVVVLDDTERTDVIAATLANAFPDQDVRRWSDLASFYQKVVTLYHGIFTVMGVIILLVVLLSVTNTMLMSIMERVREAGTMMAFGVPRARLRLNFALEGCIIGSIGAVIGLIVAALMAYGINAMELMMPAPPGRTMPVPLVIFTEGGWFAGVFAVMVALGGLSAWLPTRHIVGLKIVDALGHT